MTRKTAKTICRGIDDFGRGIVSVEGTTAFVPNLLPGEEAYVTTVFSYGKLKEAILKQRLSTSEDRVKPLCPYYPKCGGCQIRHLSYPKQLEYKTEKVKGLLHKFGGIDIKVEPCIGLAEPTRFRNKVQKPVKFVPKYNKICAGFYQNGTHDLIPIQDCLSESELSNRITNLVLSLLRKYHYPAYDEDKQTGLVRHILIKTSSDLSMALVTLVVTTPLFKRRQEFAKELRSKCKEIRGVVLNINDRKTNVILGEKEVRLAGYDKISDKIFGKTFLISSKSFYQTNSRQIEVLYGKAREYASLKPTDDVLDAYCGTGTIGLCLADKVHSVTGVEIVKDAVKDAKLNAKINKIENATFIEEDCTKYRLENEGKFSLVIRDPPRRGTTPEFIHALEKRKPERVVYVSCDPVTLARDLKLRKESFEILKVQPVDRFPNSLHVETVVELKLKK